MNPRAAPALADLPQDRVARIAEPADPAAPGSAETSPVPAARGLCGGHFSATVDAGPAVCAEFTRQSRRQLVHLVNYDPAHPAENVRVRLQLPPGTKAAKITLASPETPSDTEVPFGQSAGEVTFTVPKVNVYTIAIVDRHAG